MPVSSESDYFSLLALPKRYAIDPSKVKAAQRDLQRQFHPDRFVTAEPGERQRAAQMSATINDAVQTLLDPVRRAAYLLSISGVDADYDNITISDSGFLMEQMELRDELDELLESEGSLAQKEAFVSAIREQYQLVQNQFSNAFKEARYSEARDILARLHFFAKLYAEAGALLQSA